MTTNHIERLDPALIRPVMSAVVVIGGSGGDGGDGDNIVVMVMMLMLAMT